MKLFVTVSKKTLAAVLAAAVVILILLGQFFTIRSSGIDGSTNAHRVEYINSLGVKINESPQVKSITIPENFSEVYEKYNLLQKKAGFDLSVCKGKAAEVYTYRFADDEDMTVHIIVCDKRIVGGDISSVRIDGEMLPLIPEKEKTDGI